MSKGIKRLLVVVAVMAVATVGSAAWIQSTGHTFFNNGRAIKESLVAMGFALRAKEFKNVTTFYAADYQGKCLGLTTRKLSEDKDGIHRLLQVSDNSGADRNAAVTEWKNYLDSFDSIESVSLFIHRFDKWKSDNDLAARVRFEVIGTPHGAFRTSHRSV